MITAVLIRTWQSSPAEHIILMSEIEALHLHLCKGLGTAELLLFIGL